MPTVHRCLQAASLGFPAGRYGRLPLQRPSRHLPRLSSASVGTLSFAYHEDRIARKKNKILAARRSVIAGSVRPRRPRTMMCSTSYPLDFKRRYRRSGKFSSSKNFTRLASPRAANARRHGHNLLMSQCVFFLHFVDSLTRGNRTDNCRDVDSCASDAGFAKPNIRSIEIPGKMSIPVTPRAFLNKIRSRL